MREKAEERGWDTQRSRILLRLQDMAATAGPLFSGVTGVSWELPEEEASGSGPKWQVKGHLGGGVAGAWGP